MRKCLHPDTKVLTADLRWIPIKTVLIGQELIGISEKTPCGQGSVRQFERAYVTEKWKTRQAAYRITFEDGRTIIASGDHPFLSLEFKNSGLSAWKKVKELRPGSRVRVLFDTWPDPTYEDGWMAGLLDGEGSLKSWRRSGGNDLVISQRPGDVADRIENYLLSTVLKFHKRDDQELDGIIKRNGPVRRFVLSRLGNIINLVGRTQCTRWIKERFWEGQTLNNPERPYIKVVDIKAVGEIELIDIETSSHTFIAEGLCSHNCTQVGLSFVTLLKILYAGDKENLSIVFTLPTGGDVKDFVLSKFDPVVESSRYLYDRVERDPISRRSVFSTALKRIGGSHYFFRGSWSEHKAQSIDADILVFDELDFQKSDVLKMYEERLTGSASKNIAYYIGTPTLPGSGISEQFDRSDQMEWHILCPECELRQTLEWPRNINFQKKTYICMKCRADIPNISRINGLWIPKYPDHKIRGYSFNRLMAPWVSAQSLILSSKSDNPKHFHNYLLGLPYVEKAQQLAREEFNAILVSKSPVNESSAKRVLGIDQGNNFHTTAGHAAPSGLVIGQTSKFFSTNELEKFIDSTKPDMVVMDMFPDQHYAKGLQQRYGHRKFLLVNQRDWRNPARVGQVVEWDRPNGVVNLERTEALDRFMAAIRNKEILAIKFMKGQEELFDHLRNLVPDIEERFGKKKKVYKKIGKDDFAHSSNYFFVGASLLFPVLQQPHESVISSTVGEDPLPGSREWMADDLVLRAASLSGSDTIVIPPKQY